jgi:hypothetical protein
MMSLYIQQQGWDHGHCFLSTNVTGGILHNEELVKLGECLRGADSPPRQLQLPTHLFWVPWEANWCNFFFLGQNRLFHFFSLLR